MNELADILGRLGERHTWVRVFQVVAGSVMLIAGLVIIAGKPAVSAAATVAKVVK